MGAEVQDSQRSCFIIFCACVVMMVVVMMVVKPVENSRNNRGEISCLQILKMCAKMELVGKYKYIKRKVNMNYKTIVRGDGTATISRIFGHGDSVKVIPTYLEFNHEKDARAFEWALEMVSSVWCYHGIEMKNKYLQKYIDEFGEEAIRDEFNWLQEHCETAYAGEDSEGCWYNTIIYKG